MNIYPDVAIAYFFWFQYTLGIATVASSLGFDLLQGSCGQHIICDYTSPVARHKYLHQAIHGIILNNMQDRKQLSSLIIQDQTDHIDVIIVEVY